MKGLFLVKKFLTFLLSVVMVLSLASCGGNSTKEAQKCVEGMFDSLIALDFDAADKYVNMDEIKAFYSPEDDGSAELFMSAVFDRLGYEIINAQKLDNKNVLVKTKITAVDFETLAMDFYNQLMIYSIQTGGAQDENTEQIITDMLFTVADNATEMEENEVDILVSKNDNGYKVMLDEYFLNALYGNVTTSSPEGQYEEDYYDEQTNGDVVPDEN